MGVSTLNVWVHDIVDPCRISDHTWFINITDCKNQVVEWCGKRYAGIPARCGHVQVELPPGCYTVWGALSFAIRPPFLYANYVTHFAPVTLCCEDKQCVQLYAPTYHQCWRSILLATQFIAEAQPQAIPPEKAKQLLDIVNSVLEHVPKTAGDAALDQIFAELPAMMKQPVAEPKPG
jgi:hypothetical protein